MPRVLIRKSFKNSYTKIAQDWKVQLNYKFTSIEDARFLENFIKKMKSKVFIEKVINDNSILTDILSKK